MTESNVKYIPAVTPSAGAVPTDTDIATHTRASDGLEVQDVYLEDSATATAQALELAQLQAMNLLSSVIYDEILVTYVDATKAVISKVEWKLASSVVKTLTPTFGTTTDDWVKS